MQADECARLFEQVQDAARAIAGPRPVIRPGRRASPARFAGIKIGSAYAG